MRDIKLLAAFLICILFSTTGYSQESEKEFGELRETYFITKDTLIVEKTISYLNTANPDYENYSTNFIGFYGALFSEDYNVRKTFAAHLPKINSEDFKLLFYHLLVPINLDSLYAAMPLSATYNDMNWASFFATGNTKYLNNIISNLKYCDNRTDINLFLTGQSAKWSLDLNAREYEKIMDDLNSIKGNNKLVDELLKEDPLQIKDETINIMKEQKRKGIWK